MDESELDLVRAEYGKLARKAREDLKHGKGDTRVVEVEANIPPAK